MPKIKYSAIPTALIVLACSELTPGWGQESEVLGHLEKAKEYWDKFETSSAVVEWKEALRLDPENMTAQKALSMLNAEFGRTDEFLELMDALIRGGHVAEAETALARRTIPYASRDQQALLLVLRGDILLREGCPSQALTSFMAAETLAESEEFRLRALLGKAQAFVASPDGRHESIPILNSILDESEDERLRSEAAWTLIQAEQKTANARTEDLRQYLERYPESRFRSKVHSELATLLDDDSSSPRAAMKERIAALSSAGSRSERSVLCDRIRSSISQIEDASELEWLTGELARVPAESDMPFPPGELACLAWERMAAVGRGDDALNAARASQKTAAGLLTDHPGNERSHRWQDFQARGCLMEGQLLLMAGDETGALQALRKASDQYRLILQQGPNSDAARETLLRIGRILESRGRPDGAAYHYKLVSESCPADQIGADSLWRLAILYRDRLDRPIEAIRMFQRYQDLYPPAFRVATSSQERIRSLGYADTAGFQAAHGLKVDGMLGPNTLRELKLEEQNFREILPSLRSVNSISGNMVHQIVFDIANSLQGRGRVREAVKAYQRFLSMYPGHNLADDAWISIARIFKQNGLYLEATAVYERLMEDYPDGNESSYAYLESACCHECLGEWKEAQNLYDLYLKKFPHYNGRGEATKKRAAVRELIRYDELVKEGDCGPAKTADALYAMATILYKQMLNNEKAAEIFTEIADRFPAAYPAADARFTAGVCMLHEQDFVGARNSFEKLIKDFPESRLADDAQFWIGHACEYQARGLGELDYNRVILRKRSVRETAVLRADLALRRQFRPDVPQDARIPRETADDILEAGSAHDKVREGLHKAITAYRKVVQNHPLGDMTQKALLRIGAIYSDYLHDPDRAIEAYRELLEKYPGSSEAVNAQFAVGCHYLDKGDTAKAEKAITLFLTSFPNHDKARDALLNLAECHRRQKEWIKALDDYQSYLARYPSATNAEKIRSEIEWIKKYRF